jgi:DNA-binding response OmpR family regulator
MSAARVLIVEDEPALTRGLSDALTAHGFDVRIAHDGQSGLDAALAGDADLILLDVMLPRVNGYEICRAVRERGIAVPIVMLTARGQEQDIILGLNLGADDYVTKPFRTGELIARIRAFLRRRGADRDLSRFGTCEMDLRARTLLRDGKPVDLTAKEFRLLAYFASRPGCALSRDAILDAVWGSSVFVTPRSIDRCVATLRAKIEPEPHRPNYIHTIRDIGYRFEPDAVPAAPATAGPAPISSRLRDAEPT